MSGGARPTAPRRDAGATGDPTGWKPVLRWPSVLKRVESCGFGPGDPLLGGIPVDRDFEWCVKGRTLRREWCVTRDAPYAENGASRDAPYAENGASRDAPYAVRGMG